MIRIEDGVPLRFGADGTRAVVRNADGSLGVEDGVAQDDPRVVVHDARTDDPTSAFALSRLTSVEPRYTPMGVFRDVDRPTYDGQVAAQIEQIQQGTPPSDDDFTTLLHGSDTWVVS